MTKKVDEEVFSPTVKNFLEDFSKLMSPDLLEWMGQICDSQIVNWFDQKIDTIRVRLVVDSNIVISSLNYYANGKESILFKLVGNPLFKMYVPPELEEEIVDYIENKKKKKTVKKTKLREGWFKLRSSLNIHNEINPKYHRQALEVIGSRDIDDVPFVAIYLDLGANAILTNDKHYENPKIKKFGIDKLGEIVGSYHQGVFSFFVVYDLLPPVLEFLMKTLFSIIKSLIGYLVIILKVIVAAVTGTVSKTISIISKAPQGIQIFLLAGLVGAFFAGFVWPFYNLIPEYVTEEVTIVDNKQGMCYIKTDDNFMIPAGDVCGDAKAGDRIPVEYDVKIKDRMDAAVRHP